MASAEELGFRGTVGADIGRDQGGIYRNITREFRVPEVLKNGDYSQLSYSDICREALSIGGPNNIKLKANIVDTVVFDGGSVEAYLYTDVDGNVSRKPKAMLQLARIRKQFLDGIELFQPTGSKYVALAEFDNAAEPKPLNGDDFDLICKSPPANLVSLQMFVASKGDQERFRTFETCYTLDRTARNNMRTEKLDFSEAVSGAGKTSNRANMNRRQNDVMETMCQELVHKIQQATDGRVVRMRAQYVEDVQGRLWLLRTSDAVLVQGKPVQRPPSPEVMKALRSNVLERDLERPGSSESWGERPPSIGRHSDGRVSRRELREQKRVTRNEGAVEDILAAGVQRATSPARPRSSVDHRAPSAITTHAVNARLGSEVPVASGTQVFGSTQLEGCAGDFCSTDLDNLQASDVSIASGPPKVKLSEFRAKLMETAGPTEDDFSLTSSSSLKKSKRKRRGTAADDGASLDSSSRSSHAMEDENATHRMPMRLIIQTRQEMPLVKLLLTRYRRGEHGDYVAQDSYGDLAVGGKLPSHYYKDVQCCTNCFKVYTLVDEARTKALQKLHPPKQGSLRGRSQSPDRRKGGDTSSHYDLIDNSFSSSIETVADGEHSLQSAVTAIDGLTKLDVAEIRTMTKPPAAVEIVLEAVMCLLTGKTMAFSDTKRLLGGGEAFLLMLREFRLDDVSDARLRLVEPYVDNPVFRPHNVEPVSHCASKFCAWVLGVVQAARWHRGVYHRRTDLLATAGSAGAGEGTAGGMGGDNTHLAQGSVESVESQEMTFAQRLERKRAKKSDEPLSRTRGRQKQRGGGSGNESVGAKSVDSIYSPVKSVIARGKTGALVDFDHPDSLMSPSPIVGKKSKTKMSTRERTAMMASQKKAADRLSSHNKNDGNMASVGNAKMFKCADGVTRMPYVVLGNISLKPTRCNFIVVHDFFDTCDGTAINFKPVIQRHDNCQVFCYNYPGQAHTVWPRPPAAEKKRGAKDPVLNNDWQAAKLHEILQHAEENGDILLTNPFHLVGIGNGVAIAAAFAQRFGTDARYASSLKSFVAVNGFLYPDPQLASILHSSAQVFESTPHLRPDIPISYWCRYIFSEEYLTKVNSNLALNIYTAVSNPITNEGRMKITKGCLQNRDLRGGLHPDLPEGFVSDIANSEDPREGFFASPIKVPVVLLQSTENLLVNASNVDPFLVGRNSKNLWSHQLNHLSEAVLHQAADVAALWVGKRSSGPEDYAKFSLLGKSGLRGLLDTLRNPRAGYVIWTRSGHHLLQENKTAILDLMDALACPQEEYYGLADPSASTKTLLGQEQKQVTQKMEILFKIAPPKKLVKGGITGTSPDEEEEEAERSFLTEEPSHTMDETSRSLDHPMSIAEGDEEEGEGIEVEPSLDGEPDPASLTADSLELHQPAMDVEVDVAMSPEKESFPSGTYGSVSGRDVSEEESMMIEADAQESISTPVPPQAASPIQQHRQDEVEEEEENEEEEEAIEISAPSVQPRDRDSDVPHDLHARPSSPPSPVLAAAPAAPAAATAATAASVLPTSPVRAPETHMRWERGQQHPTPSAAPFVRGEVIAATPSLPGRALPDRYKVSEEKIAATPSEVLTHASPPKRFERVATPDAVDAAAVAQSTGMLSSPVKDPFREPERDLSEFDGAPVPDSPTKKLLAERPADDYSEFSELDATKEQRRKKEWAAEGDIPRANESLEMEADMERRRADFAALEANKKKAMADEAMARLQRIKDEQARRRREYEEEDNELLSKLEEELKIRRAARAAADKQRRVQMQQLESVLLDEGLVDAFTPEEGKNAPIVELPPMDYEDPVDLPKVVTEAKDPASVLERMLEDEEEARKRGIMSVDEFEKVKRQQALRQMERDQKLRHLGGEEQSALMDECARTMQRYGRGYTGRKRARKLAAHRHMQRILTKGSIQLQALVRGMCGRRRFNRLKAVYLMNLAKGESANRIQKLYRGVVARRIAMKKKRFVKARRIQSAFRGHVGRLTAARERKRLHILVLKRKSAAIIQSAWRMKVAREEFRSLRIHMLAATEIQRLYRGHLGRKIVERRREWDSTEPGPERVKLGLKIIEESKLAFERQQEEIDALHRAQERAEARVSHIHSELKESEKELVVLEKELQEIDQIERDLQALTHERDLLSQGIRDAAGMPRIAQPGNEGVVMGRESTTEDDPDLERRKKAEAYALEMTIQIKRAEREKKRQELETEFAAVFQEVEKKKKALIRLEASLADMEATRERKDREFRRLQKNLMQLLLEQKQELDDLREKGIELETATATTAAAATATALKAKEHEERSTVMFSQTEELMKFQFMSMSLSYFSSLNMLKQLRDMNADTTSAAVASSADAASAAAAAAAAANLPSMKKLDLGANDFVEMSITKKKEELAASEAAERESRKAKANPMPEQVRLWSVADVCRWLDTLSLGQYAPSFREATVDGPFLMELREEDMVQILGIRHKLHVRKILVSREKLKPLSDTEKKKKAEAERELEAERSRNMQGVPDLDTVFSQARNARNKRCEESLNMGFPIDSEDERGNTLLLVACQQNNRRLVEMLLVRGANVNHANSLGNTALHFALSFDTEGELAEYLIEHGADDTIENIEGMSPYDGVATGSK